MKNFYFVVTMHQGGGLYACVQKVSDFCNLVPVFNRPNVITVNIMKTKKQAVQVAAAWNAEYKRLKAQPEE